MSETQTPIFGIGSEPLDRDALRAFAVTIMNGDSADWHIAKHRTDSATVYLAVRHYTAPDSAPGYFDGGVKLVTVTDYGEVIPGRDLQERGIDWPDNIVPRVESR